MLSNRSGSHRSDTLSSVSPRDEVVDDYYDDEASASEDDDFVEDVVRQAKLHSASSQQGSFAAYGSQPVQLCLSALAIGALIGFVGKRYVFPGSDSRRSSTSLSSIDAWIMRMDTPLPGLDVNGVCVHNATWAALALGDSVGSASQGVNSRRLTAAVRPPSPAAARLRRRTSGLIRDPAWASALSLARFLVANMTTDEKAMLVRGIGWENYNILKGYYVGSIPPIPRLGLPSINMQDGPQGFRTFDGRIVGTVTAWPCQLALGATWDTKLAERYGAALGKEVADRGANVILGPGVNVARVARNGRNAEYLTGEEPLLGARLAAEYVRGVQAQGVAVSVKHFVANSQETLRNSLNSIISERALREVYYVPFESAVHAGAASVMCSYNKVNGVHTCGNAKVLKDLKDSVENGGLGFEGWVMSDWWAVATEDAFTLVDQEMPGTPAGDHLAYFSDRVLHAAARAGGGAYGVQVDAGMASRLDAMAIRIVGGMMRAGAFDEARCTVACDCPRLLFRKAPQGGGGVAQSHVALNKQIAAESIVLLKNRDEALPLIKPEVLPEEEEGKEEEEEKEKKGEGAPSSPPKLKVALVGSACSAHHTIDTDTADWKQGDYFVVGGSGRVVAPTDQVLSIRDALEEVAWLKITASPTDLVSDAIVAMEGVDVVIACGGATSTESLDRINLQLDQHAFLSALSHHHHQQTAGTPRAPKLVVLATAPGAILTQPWAKDADAVALMFLGGAQSGPAWRDVLLGHVNPSGRLPITLPLTEADTVAPCEVSPCHHTEGLHIGWRALTMRQVAFPFGHGLSYTSFEHSFVHDDVNGDGGGSICDVVVWPSGGEYGGESGLLDITQQDGAGEIGVLAEGTPLLSFQVKVRNTGRAAGAEVVQAYLEYPSDAGEPPLVLRGFEKTQVLPVQGEATVTFELTKRDLSIWDDSSSPGRWRVAPGRFGLLVGRSSRDVRQGCQFWQSATPRPDA